MKIGILKTDDVNPALVTAFGEYPEQFQTLLSQVDPSLEFVTYDVTRGEYPVALDEVDGYLITGSKAGVYDDLPWIAELAAFIRKLYHSGHKLVGICFGHQLVAQALGGRAAKAEQGWGIGVHSVVLQSPPETSVSNPALAAELAAGRSLSLLVSHQDQVLEPAPGAEVLAGSEFCPIAITRLDRQFLTFQGHPEFVAGYVQGLMALRREQYGETLYQTATASLQQPTDHLLVARWIVDFLSPDNATG